MLQIELTAPTAVRYSTVRVGTRASRKSGETLSELADRLTDELIAIARRETAWVEAALGTSDPVARSVHGDARAGEREDGRDPDGLPARRIAARRTVRRRRTAGPDVERCGVPGLRRALRSPQRAERRFTGEAGRSPLPFSAPEERP